MSDQPKPASAHPRAVGVELIQDLSGVSKPVEGFLRRHRLRLKTLLDDGTRTETYIADYVDRAPERRDAVAVVLCAEPGTGAPEEVVILLRRQLRYPTHLIEGAALFTEVVAGLIEDTEALDRAAVREVSEEAGIDVAPDRIEPLGPPFFASPGILTERIFPMLALVPEAALREAIAHPPEGDGSPMEEGAELVLCGLGEAIAATQIATDSAGDQLALSDAKTEITLRRAFDRIRDRQGG